MEFRLLGPVEVRDGDQPVALGGPKERSLLTVLLLHANRVVPAARLVDQLWGDIPPRTATNLLQGHVSRLRRALRRGNGRPASGWRLLTRLPGYMFEVDPDEVDLYRFERLLAEGNALLAANAPERGADLLRQALALWRGPALADIAPGSVTEAEVARLEESRLAAVEARIEADLACGGHRHLVGELEALVATHPLRERLRRHLMLALYRSGRQAEALDVYRQARRVLVQELGLEPGAALQRLQRAILSGDPSLELALRSIEPAERPRPCQLPPDIDDFTDRNAALKELRGLLEREQATATVVAAVTGKAGVGKTALAVRVAHELRPRFSDGQLYVNLRGHEAPACNPADVLAEFLRALGVEGGAIPKDLEERERLYRTSLADRRILVVLDNAAGEAQVRPLLPGSRSCAALITSRSPLAGLEAVQSVTLKVFNPDHAIELLGRIVGRERVAAEPEAARALVGLCGCLPLAVRIAGAKLATKSHWRLAQLVARLSDERRRLGELRAGDRDVRSSFALGYQGLGEDERRTFRLLGLVDAPDFASWVAAALLDIGPSDAESLVERLVDAQFLEVAGSDVSGQVRYRFHDLLRLFARERLLQEEPEPARRAALERLLHGYLILAERADAALLPDGSPQAMPESATRDQVDALDAGGLVDGDPLVWFTVERASLTAAVRQASEAELWELTGKLVAALAHFFETRAHWRDWEETHELAIDASRRIGDRLGEGDALCRLGDAYKEQGRLDEAVACLNRCLAMFRGLGDRRREAYALRDLGATFRDQGRLSEAVACFDRSLAVFRELGLRLYEAYTLTSLGTTLRAQGRLEDAAACFDRCLTIFGHYQDRRGQAYNLRNLGDVRRDQGRLEDAAALLDRSLPILRELGDHLGEAYALCSLGGVRLDQGCLDDAVTCFDGSLAVFRRLGVRLWEGRALSGLGLVLALKQEHGAARSAWRGALAIFERLGASESATVQGWLDHAAS